MTQETIVRIKVVSQTRTPNMITAIVGLQCDKCWVAGDQRKHTTILEKDNGWVLHSKLPKSADVNAHLKSILDALEPAKEAIRGLSVTETLELSVVIYSSSVPALNFDSPTIARIAELGAGLDIDVYVT